MNVDNIHKIKKRNPNKNLHNVNEIYTGMQKIFYTSVTIRKKEMNEKSNRKEMFSTEKYSSKVWFISSPSSISI